MGKLPRYGDADYCPNCGSTSCSYNCYHGIPEPDSEGSSQAVGSIQPAEKDGFFFKVVMGMVMAVFLGLLLGPLLVLPSVLVFLFQ